MVAASIPTFGVAGIGCASLLTLGATLALVRSLGFGEAWEDFGILAGMLAGLGTAIAVGVQAARSWDAAGRLLDRAGAIAIGADGARWGAGADERFVPWSEVERVDEEPTLEDELGTLVLVCRDGEVVRLFVEESEELARNARSALEAYRGAAAEPVLDLEPNGRDVPTWIEHAKHLLGAGSYRGAVVSAERLVSVASTPAAPAAQRLGAAISLSSAPDALRTKVRVALVDTADDELRDVMEDALEGRALDARAVARAIAR